MCSGSEAISAAYRILPAKGVYVSSGWGDSIFIYARASFKFAMQWQFHDLPLSCHKWEWWIDKWSYAEYCRKQYHILCVYLQYRELTCVRKIQTNLESKDFAHFTWNQFVKWKNWVTDMILAQWYSTINVSGIYSQYLKKCEQSHITVCSKWHFTQMLGRVTLFYRAFSPRSTLWSNGL